MRVLVCEREPDLRELLERQLAAAGFEPVDCEDAFDAAVIETGTSEGLELLRRVRHEHPDTPVVCLSVYPLDDAVAALRPSAFLTKPVRLEALRLALVAALGSAA